MAILSDIDIKKELGKNIYIYPFNTSQLKGASYNLTASKLAWSLSTKKSIYDRDSEKIIIPPDTTALIETSEVIWVSQEIAGTYHSRVGMVSQGSGHIGTTLDPNYIGPSLIAIHNHHPKRNIELIPGEEDDAILTLVFHYVKTESSRKQHGNSAGRIEILNQMQIELSDEDRRALSKDFMSNPYSLKLEMEKKCEDYQQLERERKRESEEIERKLKQEAEEKEKKHEQERQQETEKIEKKLKQEAEEKEKKRQQEADEFFKNWYIILGLIFVILLFLSVLLYVYQANLSSQSWYVFLTAITDKSIAALIAGLIALGISDLQRRTKKFEK
jgi:deoxycytidine triphosphate deaminase